MPEEEEKNVFTATSASSARRCRSHSCCVSYCAAACQVRFGCFCSPHIKAQYFRFLAPTDWLPVWSEDEHASSPYLDTMTRGFKKVEECCAARAMLAGTPLDFATMLNQDRGSSQILQADELRRLEGFLAQMAELPTPEEYERWEVPQRAFHLSLVAHAGTRIVTMIAQLSDHAERYRRFYSTEAPRAFERGVREHQAIVDACLARDPGVAAERLARHSSSIALGTLAVLAPEYDPVLVRTALHSVMQTRTGGKYGTQDSE